MKFSSFTVDGRSSYGLVQDDQILEPEDQFRAQYPDLKSVLAGSTLQLAADSAINGHTYQFDYVACEPVIPNAGKILCVGVNYQAHMEEMFREMPKYPWLFVRFPDSQVGHKQDLVHPGVTDQYDFEGEFAFVIGKQAHRVAAQDALDYVAGYTCFMDGSVRDYQRHGSQFTPGKNFWHSGSMGPWFVSADKIPDPKSLTLETRLNGEVMQQGEVSDLKFGVAELIEYCSTFAKLMPGDVISTGTPSGVGAARTPPIWLQPGDRLEVEVSEIGVLKNSVVVG
ncbi:MAG: fumarylacetoacetate hydrolase family protein [Gammaproteobacteria bacterium]